MRYLALAILLLLALAPSAPAAERTVPQGFFGAVYDGELRTAPDDVQERQWDLMASSGVESVRVMFSWDEAQPDPSQPPSFAISDQHVARAVRRRIRILPVVIYAPPWARKDPQLYNSPPRRTEDYTAFLEAIVARYGRRGSFWGEHPELPKRPLTELQIWNEPQLRYQWNDDEYLRGYSALLRDSYRTVKRLDRGTRVVLAGLTNDSWRALEELYERGDSGGNFDAVGLAPFTASAGGVIRILKLARRVMRRHGDARMPLWVTELSWPASKGRIRSRSPLQTTERGKAKRLARAYTLLVRNVRNRDVRVSRAYWYTWSSSYEDQIFRFSGLQRFDGSSFRRNPAYWAYVRAARRYEGCVKTAAGVCRR